MISKKTSKEKIYETWMKQESDLIQAVATAFGERMVLERFIHLINTNTELDSSHIETLNCLRSLYALSRLSADMGWILSEGLIPPKQGTLIQQEIRSLCTLLSPMCEDLTKGFGIPEHLLFAPIANDWVAYNEFDNQGELVEWITKRCPPNQQQS